MSEVKRYTIVECHNDEEFWAKMKEVKHGDYVTYNDYKELEQQKAELINILKSIAKMKENDENELSRITKEIIDILEKYK